MIPFDFDYYKPESVQEAVQAFTELDSQGKAPLYYGGGTEIITMARANNISTKAVIDLKGIPDCTVLEMKNDKLITGSAVTLTQITESELFPLLEKSAGRIADHTTQGKITLGGNIAATIIYRETVLAFLLSDSEVIIAGPGGKKQVPLFEIFNERVNLSRGEFIVQIITDRSYTTLPFVHAKKTKNEKIDYPLLTIAAIKKSGRLRLAFSGVCSFPFRSLPLEDSMNNREYSKEEKVDNAIAQLPAPILNDISASAEYRKFVLRNTLLNTLKTFEGVK